MEYQGKNLYKGKPFFAVDVSPKGNLQSQAEELVKQLEGKGIGFARGRVMELEAGDGESLSTPL